MAFLRALELIGAHVVLLALLQALGVGAVRDSSLDSSIDSGLEHEVVSNATEQYSHDKEELGNDQVMVCEDSVHTYINLGDGGCFMHLRMDGSIKQGEEEIYKAKFCPLADDAQQVHRKSMLDWYIAVTAPRPQPSITDLAQQCLISMTEPEQMSCDAALALPLMFDAIGFDHPGMVLEDSRAIQGLTLKGVQVKLNFDEDETRSTPEGGCKKLLGSSKFGRIVLRAMLPTYVRHVYTESAWGMIKKATRIIVSPGFSDPDHWHRPLAKVCLAAWDNRALDRLFSVDSLRSAFELGESERSLHSQQVLNRDAGTCQNALSCNFHPDAQQHVGACELCGKYPCFDSTRGRCFSTFSKSNPEKGEVQGECRASESMCQDASAPKKSCGCYKSICWYFTADFEKAFKKAMALPACKSFAQE